MRNSLKSKEDLRRISKLYHIKDGIVVVGEGTCIGCKLCIHGCPYGVMFYNEVESIAGKCDSCTSRIQHGPEPACVQHCIGGALQFVTHEELTVLTAQRHTVSVGTVSYASSKLKLAELF